MTLLVSRAGQTGLPSASASAVLGDTGRTRGTAYRGVPAKAALKVSSATFSEILGRARDRSRILAQYIGQRESVRNKV